MPSNTPTKRQDVQPSTIVKIVIISLLVIALLGYLGWDIIAQGPLMQLLGSRDRLVELMRSLGIWAPLVYIILQIVQIIVAPIPGQIVGGVGGFLFGPWGILWTSIGSIIGFMCVFWIARRFGRPLLEKIFKKSAIDKFDFIINAKGAALILFAIFLLPGFPDDVVCYIAGLTKLSIKKLMVIAILGRLPTIIVTNFIGAGLGENNIGLVAGVSIIGVIILGIFTWKREAIIRIMKGGEDVTENVEENMTEKLADEKQPKSKTADDSQKVESKKSKFASPKTTKPQKPSAAK